jgi:hypothetical protein
MTEKLLIWAPAPSVVFVQLPNGETLQFPAREPGRLMAYLTNRARVPAPIFNQAAWEQARDRKMREVREKEDARRANEQARHLRSDEKRMARADAYKLLEEVGL